MFEWLFQNRQGEMQSLLEVISASMTKIQLAALAQEKAACMIAKAIAKSEIVLSQGERRRKDIEYWRLNIRPNDNETGTDFWFQVARQLVKTGDCVVARVNGGKYYRVASYTMDNYVLFAKTYSNIVITDGTNEVQMKFGISSDDILHFRFSTEKMRTFTDNVLSLYNDALAALQQMETISNRPIFKYRTDANAAFIDRKTNKRIAVEDVLEKLKAQIESTDISIIWERNGAELECMDLKAKVAAADVTAMAEMINNQCAAAYDIPTEVFSGHITEQSDATNEFITYAVSPIAEVINDTLNGKLVGPEDYEKGERAFVWLAHFKHIDVIDAASNLSALRGIGFTLDEIFEMVGYPALGTDFSTTRALTKNYAAEGSEEGGSPTGGAEDRAEEPVSNSTKRQKHKERRSQRYGKE